MNNYSIGASPELSKEYFLKSKVYLSTMSPLFFCPLSFLNYPVFLLDPDLASGLMDVPRFTAGMSYSAGFEFLIKQR